MAVPALGFLIALDFVRGQGSFPSAVGSQANTDAAAQRRLQETAREAQRQRRIEEQLHRLTPALNPAKLAGAEGPALARRALGALVRLREEGISPEDALARAARSVGGGSGASAQPSAYLRNLFVNFADKITPAVLNRLEAGENPAPAFTLPPYPE